MTSGTSFVETRRLAVVVGDEIALLVAMGPGGFPTPSGTTLDLCVTTALAAISQLIERTTVEWKRKLLERTGLELQQLLDACVRESDLARAEELLGDAEGHFREYLQGVEHPASG